MPDASYTQASFLGGEWSPFAQGRTDTPAYKTAMNVCLNGYPVEEGAWVRRPGMKFKWPTHGGGPAREFLFAYSETIPYVMEFTDGCLRLSVGDLLVMDSAVVVNSVSTDDPALVITADPHGWTSGDIVQFVVTGGPPDTLAPIKNRQLAINVISDTSFTIHDPITSDSIDGSTILWDTVSSEAQISRVLILGSPYVGNWYNNRIVQFNNQAVVLNEEVMPYTLTLTDTSDPTGQFNQFEFGPTASGGIHPFEDGPYFDAVPGSTVTPAGTSGVIQITFNDTVGPNQNVLLPGDVGRLIRFYSTPLDFDKNHTYAAGDHVQYGAGTIPLPYTAVQATTGNFPDISPDDWILDPNAAQWVAGIITSVNSPVEASVQLEGDLLYEADITTWRLGRFGGQEGWPKAGCFHEGRIWLCKGNQIFSSMVNQPFVFSPTDGLGNVADNNGITYTLEAGTQDANALLWMHSELSGIVCGSIAGEWLVQASTLTDPLTPTTVQAKRVTKYGCADIQPVKAPLALIFVQKEGHRVMEFLPDVFTGKYLAPNLSERAKHLTSNGIEEVSYMETLTPIIWVRTTDGFLNGITYRRKSSFPSEEATIIGWHRHGLGSDRRVFSSIVVPAPAHKTDTLSVVTGDGTTTGYWVERSTKQFDVGDTLLQSFHLDEAVAATSIVPDDNDPPTGVTVYGAYQWVGEEITAWVGGLDCGDYTVAADGSVFVPFQSDPGKLLTNAYLQSLNGQDFGEATSVYTSSVTTVPARSPLNGTVGEYVGSGNTAAALVGVDWATNVAMYGVQPGGGLEVSFRSYNLETRSANADVDVRDIAWVLGIDLTNHKVNGGSYGAYDSGHNYAKSDLVIYSGDTYISLLTGNMGNQPDMSAGQWQQLTTWDEAKTNYAAGQYVVAPLGDGSVLAKQLAWVCLVGGMTNTNKPPATNPTFWAGPVTIASATNLGSVFTMGADGNFYAQIAGGTREPIYKINPATLTASDEFGDMVSSGTSGPLGISYSGGMCSVACGNITYLVSVSAQFGDLAVVDGTNMKYAGHDVANVGSGLVNNVFMCAGRTAIGGSPGAYSEVFTLNSDGVLWNTRITQGAPNSANLSSAPVWSPRTTYQLNASVLWEGRNWVSLIANNKGNQPADDANWHPVVNWSSAVTYAAGDKVVYAGLVYTSDVGGNLNIIPSQNASSWTVVGSPGISTSQVYTIAPDQIDPAWTTFNYGPIGYDPTDGNLLAYFTTDDAVTNTAYFVKLYSTDTGISPVIWATAVNPFITPPNLQFARITGGSYGFMGDNSPTTGQITLLNTLTGATTLSASIAGVAPTDVQVYDGITGHLVSQVNYDSTVTGAPTPLSGTPTTFNQGWALFLPGTAFLADTTSTVNVTGGAVLGKTYTSQGQILRPGTPQDAGAANGPPLGKTRRTHMYSALFANAITTSVQIGTDASVSHTNVRAITFKTPGGIPYAYDEFFSGVQWGSLGDTYSFDSMLLWQVPRPYPLTVVSLGAFINTQDR